MKDMKEKYCAFLRGINVNGVNIKMDALKEAFVGMGFPDAQTILATGNVIFTPAEGNPSGQEAKAYIEKELGRNFSYDAHVILRSRAEVRDVLNSAEAVDVPEECHLYYLLCDDAQVLPELEQLFGSVPHAPDEKLIPLRSGAFWIVPKGSTLSSDFGSKVLGNKKYKNRLTSRNINTIQKVYKTMAG